VSVPTAAAARAGRWGWFTLYLPGVEIPLFARPGTSDLKSFQAIFGRRQHDFPFRREPRVIFDLGANAGFSTVDLALRFPRARIVAVEAEASNVHLLRMNVAELPQVEVVHAAVWPHPGRLVLQDPGRDKWGFEVHEDGDGPVVGEVEAVTIPELMERAGVSRVDLLKVDIEGAEHELIVAGPAWLRRVGALVIELHETHPGASAATAAVLARHGLRERARHEENRYYEAAPPVAPQPSPRRRRRTRVRVALAAAVAGLVVFGAIPEALGDWPYNPVGADSRAVGR